MRTILIEIREEISEKEVNKKARLHEDKVQSVVIFVHKKCFFLVHLLSPHLMSKSYVMSIFDVVDV